MKALAEEPSKQFSRLGLALLSQLSKYENGRVLPALDSLGRLLEALEVRQDAFFSVVAMLADLQEHLSAEPGSALPLITTIPSLRSLPALDSAFASTFQTLLVLQRSVLHLLFAGAPLPAPGPPDVTDPVV
jgi:hypothetical protein